MGIVLRLESRPVLASMALLVLVALQGLGADQPRYMITDLGAGLEPQAINSAGHVAGYFLFAPDTLHAFLWRDGLRTDLGPVLARGIKRHRSSGGRRCLRPGHVAKRSGDGSR
jgi:probable HAF family extracellular repeat protein